MNRKQILKNITDIAMTVILLLLMAYSLIGEKAHEWLGIGMFVLFVLHHVLNSKWSRNIRKGKYTPFRILQTVLVILVFCSMIGSMVSGIVLSRYALDFLPITGGSLWARTVHMLSAYWGFFFMALHIGLHWNVALASKKRSMKKSKAWNISSRIFCAVISIYGIYAVIKRQIDDYMLLKIQFVFFDYDESILSFLLDYIAILVLFITLGYFLTKILIKSKIEQV